MALAQIRYKFLDTSNAAAVGFRVKVFMVDGTTPATI